VSHRSRDKKRDRDRSSRREKDDKDRGDRKDRKSRKRDTDRDEDSKHKDAAKEGEQGTEQKTEDDPSSKEGKKNAEEAAAAAAAEAQASAFSRVDFENLRTQVNVTESNGEISCSVDDTNKLRAMLGLKPLKTDLNVNAEVVAVANFKSLQAVEQKDRELAEIQVRLDRAKKRRLLSEKATGETIATAADASSTSSAVDWVKKSRKLEKSKVHEAKLMAEAREHLLQEQEDAYKASDLKGLKVAHAASEIKAGHEVILTLKDTEVLDADDDGVITGLNEADDELVNVNLVDDARTKHLIKVKRRAKQAVYTGVDDDEFDIDPDTGKPRSTKKVLGHYDELDEKADEMVLDDDGAIAGTAPDMDTDQVDENVPLSLQVNKKEASEYYTSQEMAAFRKPKKMKRKKSKGKVRKKEALDLDANTAAVPLSEGNDHGSRAGKNNKVDTNDVAQSALQSKRAAYDQAKEKSAAKLVAAFSTQPDEEDDAELTVSLARARRLALLRDAQSRKHNSNAAVVKESMEKMKEEEHPEEGGGDGMIIDTSSLATGQSEAATDAASEIAKDDGKIVFTSTTEFSARLMVSLTDRAEKKKSEINALAASLEDDSAAAAAADKQTKEGGDGEDMEIEEDTASGWAAEKQTDGGPEEGEEKEGEDEAKQETEDQGGVHGDAQMAFMHMQPLVRTGMAATLGLLSSAGDLSQNNKGTLQIGRAKDERGTKGEIAGPEDRIKIEHRDSDGHLLTKKEAFRQLSYRFHGHGPGQKKKEKRRKEVLEAEANMIDTQNYGTAAALQKAQIMTKSAYIPLMGGSVGASIADHDADQEFAISKKPRKSKKRSHE